MEKFCVILLMLVTYGFEIPASGQQAGQRSVKGLKLKVSADRRHLEEVNGKPFFYLGDTVWTLFKRLTREEADDYLKNRAAKGFTVIQAYVQSRMEGAESPGRGQGRSAYCRAPAVRSMRAFSMRFSSVARRTSSS